MNTNEFEKAFSDFLESRDYDDAEEWLFTLLRAAFLAGWKSAGGTPPTTTRIFELLKK